jgi:hypothetical protein
MKLALVVGHCFDKQGAKAVWPLNQTEYEYNSEIARTTRGMGIPLNIDVEVFYRDGLGITKTYKKVGDWDPDAIIELHFNAASNNKARGTETLAGEDEMSKEWAEYVQAFICEALGRTEITDRGVKQIPNCPGENGWYQVNSVAGAPNALIEPFFGSNPGEAQLGADRKIQLCHAILDAFNAWFKKEPNALVTHYRRNDPQR